MRLTSSGAYARAPPVPKMPAGLVELMEDLTRNVLRHNPTNVFEFCAGHMEKLLEIRDGRASKQVLTLEQKIARVQEKMNKKAELRRQKYDKQMHLYCLNSNLEQTSEQPSNVVEDISINLSETNSNQLDDQTKQTIKVIQEENPSRLNLNILDNQFKSSLETSPDQEFNIKNKVEEFIPKNEVEEINTKELEYTVLDKDIDMNIGVETKDSVEKDFVMQANSNDSITNKTTEYKGITDEVENQTKNLIENFQQDVQTNEDLEESNSSHNIVNKNDSNSTENEPAKSMDNYSDKDIAMQTLTNETVAANLTENKTSHLDVSEDPENPRVPLKEVIETKIIKDEFIEENGGQDQTTLSNGVEDESKGPIPVHHEQDLVEDLEVEIFHEPRESNKISKKDTSDPQDTIENDLKNNTAKDKSIKQGQYSTKDNNSFGEQYEEPLTQEYLSKTTSSANLKSHSVDDHLKFSEVNSFECTNTNIESSQIEVGGNVHNCDHVNTSDVEPQINYTSGSSPENETSSGITEASVVGQKELNNEEYIIAEIVHGSAHEKEQESVEDITNNLEPKEKDNTKANVQDVTDKSSSNTVVYETPMKKKEYALLLPEKNGEDKIEPRLKEEMPEEIVSTETNENIHNTVEKHNSEDENIVTNTDDAGCIKEANLQTTDIKENNDSSVDNVQAIKNIDELQVEKGVDDIEKSVMENAVTNIIHHNLDSHIEINPEVKEQININKEQEFEKVFSDKYNEANTSNNDIIVKSKSATLEEKSSDAEESVSNISEISQKTETAIINDSADESTVGDSNDSLIDQDVEIINRSEENYVTRSTMDLETAAVTIQKVFRTFLFKSRCSTFEDTSTDETNPITDEDNEKEELEYPITKERRALGISRMDTVLQTVNEEKSLSVSTDDSSTLSSAATVIQAHVRGFLTRNKLNSHKNSSLVNSNGPSTQSVEGDEQQKRTVLNIHIVPEDHFLSRDESLITSMDLSLDGTPPSSVNLHPLGYDKSEPRKQLKREDAIQSISPPSNNSGKMSEDVDSVKEMVINDIADPINVSRADTDMDSDSSPTKSNTLETVVETIKGVEELSISSEHEIGVQEADLQCKRILTKMSSDEGDVITPFEHDRQFSIDSDRTSHLLHSGEFHDIVLPTKVIRSDTSVVRGE